MAQRPPHRHILFRSPSETSGLRSRPSQPSPAPGQPSDGGDTQCSSVLYIPTGGAESEPTASQPTTDSNNRSVLFVRPTQGVECHRTGLQIPVNVDQRPPPTPLRPSPAPPAPVHTARLFASPRPRSQTPNASPVPSRGAPHSMVVMNSSVGVGGPGMPSISCRDNVLEIRPASGDCCVRVNASPGGKVRIKIPSTQQSSRVTRFRIADSLKLYGESEGAPRSLVVGPQGATADIPPDWNPAGPLPTSIRLVGLRTPSEAVRAAARAQKRHSYAFEGDQEEALVESRIDNFVLESLSEVCDSNVKSESKIFHILANKIENQGPEAGNLWTAFSIPELINFLKILEIEERDMKKAVIFKYKLLKYRISKLMSAQRKLSQ